MSAVPRADRQTRALASLGAMTATVAHELRNLLGGIELYATLVAEHCAAAPELAPVTGRLLSGVKRLHALADNLLAVSRPDRPAERSPVDLARLVAEAVDGAALALQGAGVRVVRPTPTLKAPVLGDAERLRQALLNLVLNAVQAMPGGGVLTVALRRAAGQVELSVRDTGTGMDRATLARCLEPFFTTRPHGTGLGLAIVREITELHGGRLRITSRPGCGTTVRLAFPLAETHGATP